MPLDKKQQNDLANKIKIGTTVLWKTVTDWFEAKNIEIDKPGLDYIKKKTTQW